MVITNVRDSVACRFLGVEFAENIQDARRRFEITLQHFANQPDSLIGTRPYDFDLYVLGEYDEHTGWIDAQEPELIMTGREWYSQMQLSKYGEIDEN